MTRRAAPTCPPRRVGRTRTPRPGSPTPSTAPGPGSSSTTTGASQAGAAGEVEIGYGLAGPSRGRGLGTRAVAALVDELRARPGVRRIDAHVVTDNLASRRVLERAGFTLAKVDASEMRYSLVV